jgi:hypothetical protein
MILEIHGNGPKEDIGCSRNIQQFFMRIYDGHIATPAGRTPIKGKLQFSHNLFLPALRKTV